MLCSYLATTLEWVLSHGSRRLPDGALRLQLLVFNCAQLLTFITTLILALLFVCFGQFHLLWNSTLPTLGLFAIIYLFARQRYFLLARILYLTLSGASLAFGVYLYGRQSHLSLYCLDLALLPLLLFRPREWRWMILMTGLAFLLFIVIEFDGLHGERRPLLPALQPYVTFLFTSGAFLGVIMPSLLLFWQSNTNFRRTLRKSRMQARDERYAALGRLAAGAAHEINNPLAIVQLTLENIEGSSEMMRESPIQQRVKRGYEAIQRIHQILQKLLASTLVPVAQPESWLVRDVAQAIGQHCRRFLKTQGINLLIRTDRIEGYRVLCHRQSVIDVVDSLINHSLEAMAGQGKPRIVLTLKCEGGLFLVQVEDTGPGISEENVRSVFTPFFNTHEARQGFGLSLYSARCIAQQYGGDLSCKVGPGGLFYLSLPLVSESQSRRAHN